MQIARLDTLRMVKYSVAIQLRVLTPVDLFRQGTLLTSLGFRHADELPRLHHTRGTCVADAPSGS